MVPRDGLQESRIIKGLARGGTLKLLPVFFSFPHHGVPPKRLTNKLYERCHFSLRLAVLGARATAPSARLGREPISGLFSDQRKDVRSWAKSGLRSNPSLCPRSARSGHTPRWAQGPIEKDPMIRLPTGLCAGFCESAALISASTARRRERHAARSWLLSSAQPGISPGSCRCASAPCRPPPAPSCRPSRRRPPQCPRSGWRWPRRSPG